MSEHPSLSYLTREGKADGIHESHVLDDPEEWHRKWKLMALEKSATDNVMDCELYYREQGVRSEGGTSVFGGMRR